MTEYTNTGYTIRLASFDAESESSSFWKGVSEELVSIGKQDFSELFKTLKHRIKTSIDEDRKASFFPSPVGYVPGGIGNSARYRIREYKGKRVNSLKAYFWVGEGLEYAHIHDRDGETTITPQSGTYLTFYNHATGDWVKARSVSRPGTPYFDEAVNYSLKKLNLIR